MKHTISIVYTGTPEELSFYLEVMKIYVAVQILGFEPSGRPPVSDEDCAAQQLWAQSVGLA